jgi:hypothetical protein
MKGQPGNGSSKFQVHQDDMGGWLRVHDAGASSATVAVASRPSRSPPLASSLKTETHRPASTLSR